ncbi:putative bifunctional diguanylate cyclase/phosphodiesterase [Arthrospira platensis]|jgi:diguanylate cyclase (GGDEF)-like protein/PAS domain S-box-containing protein|uniref:Uncharacterized protein n=1 Tax=Limnospira platensis NIES-46 TaxID=1236695 RepID=A0A5M3T574_LIMPL|nr:EAL domain-containing protein [Arthrospira platensis]AMW29760.1 diguanylate cyclase [Arthrospira platensis YZ]KDR56696.1 diguanylate cyclase [Arthrospira platensis str. Paraca]MBD2668272.1 EAL domain-containing protein [Arthrospira platensis FACHB-439]MBD2711702.1 EAL domain-containing protein [Arthrospira platensis FACHB-835]MDT9295942.1 EAL domain-containing protein [Arthrospira platensis PCC 7345]MDT9311626.1 EAL domain-containing protein [Limnospira sp. Paracas R14]QQW27683.1 EAL doma
MNDLDAYRGQLVPQLHIDESVVAGGGSCGEHDSAQNLSLPMIEHLKLLATAVCSAEDSVVITSANLEFPGPEIVFVNKAFTRMTGYGPTEAIGQTPRILQGEKTDRTILERMKLDLKAGGVFYGQTINYRKDGREFVNEWHIEPIYNDRQEITHYLAIQRDVTERQNQQNRLIYEANHDSLTGLYNRGYFRTELQKAIDRTQDSQDYLFGLLFMDLDRFKLINDSFGHQAGDQLLIEIGDRLQSCIRPQDILSRWGGDEFAILIDDIQDLSEISQLTHKIQQTIKKPILLGEENLETVTSLSIGIALSSMGYNCSEDMLRDADTALYRAKERGKGSYAIFTQAMHHQVRQQLQLETDLRYALKRQELILNYQPIISMTTNRIVGCEALLRWEHKTFGCVSPAKFIPIAEETGLICPLGDWVIEQACIQAKQWESIYQDLPPFISVNLATKQLTQAGIVETIKEILEATKCSPELIKFELTETAIAESTEVAVTTLRKIKDLGIRLCIDDFGTGHSSLSRLSCFPIDTLKIDRSFIKGINASEHQTKIAYAIVKLAQSLGMETIAEGIENLEQFCQLKSWGCELAQGFLMAEPIASETFQEVLNQNLIYPMEC